MAISECMGMGLCLLLGAAGAQRLGLATSEDSSQAQALLERPGVGIGEAPA